MPDIHPTATLTGEVVLHDDVIVGPNCVITGPVTVGAGTRLVGNVYLEGPITLGRDNIVYPFTCLGFSPQHANVIVNVGAATSQDVHALIEKIQQRVRDVHGVQLELEVQVW